MDDRAQRACRSRRRTDADREAARAPRQNPESVSAVRPPLFSWSREVREPCAPLIALRRVAGERFPFARLVAGTGFRGTPWSFVAAAPERVRSWRVADSRPLTDVLADLRPARVRREGPRAPFAGGWAGFLSYEARSWVERTPRARRPSDGFPVAWWGWYPAAIGWDHRRGRCVLSGVGESARAAREAADALWTRVRRAAPPARAALAGRPRAVRSGDSFRDAVASARAAVRAGDIFQANVSQRFVARRRGAAVDLFARLVVAQPAPYMTFVGCGEGRAVLSASPERFLQVTGRRVWTDPMKGTRPRGATAGEDRALRRDLDASEKDRAELAMIVDLSRNDLSRVCEAGTVRVAVARRLIAFARVHQAIGVVRGRLAHGRDRVDLLAATFPPGSVTGAPKVRAMEVIDALEGEPRGPYCGAIGWMDAGGDMDLAVAIRTIVLSPTRATYRVGAGITLRSDPEAERRETLDKGSGLFAALSGREDVP
jgi:para-aminobenzoate synthetase component 1